MRDAIARAAMWVLRLLLPARGRHAAPESAPEPAGSPVAVSAWLKPWNAPSAEEVRSIFLAKETEPLPLEQRERLWAAAFAELGIDYDHPTTNITPVRAVSA
ncbi:hypothetical protein AB0B50_43555 [Streptomyces sp. NPDC041068]|uniref:hypothetical protein n=1 Tax=Streptomyces sp. NPDC041068 TaxID=3155130 RepID=UPI0033D2D6FD